jgi:exonuclease III
MLTINCKTVKEPLTDPGVRCNRPWRQIQNTQRVYNNQSAVRRMNYNTNSPKISNRPNVLTLQAGDGGGAQEEPYMSVRSAHVRSGNPRTGHGLLGLAIPATVNETPNHVSPEAEDAPCPGGGSGEDETDPFWDLNIRAEDSSEDLSEDTENDNDSPLFSSDEDDSPVLRTGNINRPKRNEPRVRPGITTASLNMRGRQKDSKDKMRMVIDWLRINQIEILALQETHLMDEGIKDLNHRYRHLRFFGSGLSTLSGGILFIVNDNTGSPQKTHFEEIVKGRIGMLSLKYGSQILNIVNVYMPNQKLEQRETLKGLRRKLKMRLNTAGEDLLIMGDWNFVEDKVDRSPQHDDDHGVMNEMTKLKAEMDLIDGWRVTNPEARSFTWEGTTGNDRRKIFSRIDRIYTTKSTWELTNEYRIINCDISDHDGIAVKVRNATAPDRGKGEQKLNLNIIQHPLFKKEADQLLYKLERQLDRYERLERTRRKPERKTDLQNLRQLYNPQKVWSDYKSGILVASTRATQQWRIEITKIRRETEREIKRTERNLRDCEQEDEEKF